MEGTVREGADVDIGVLFHARPELDALADLRADLQGAISIDDIDLVPLNGARRRGND